MKIFFILCGLAFSVIAESQTTFSKLFDYSDTTLWGFSIEVDTEYFYIIGEGYTPIGYL